MIDYKYKDLYLQNGIHKKLILSFNGGEITNSDIHYESMELTERIVSGNEIVFGSCEASVFKITVAETAISLKDRWITVSEILDGHDDEPFVYGKYKVYSDVPTADRSKRQITAYDALYDILNADVASWYQSLKFPMTLKAFRDSFFVHFGITQEDAELVNDSMTVAKTIEPEELSGKVVINSICEINGCFGRINRKGNFEYVQIAENTFGLYPRNDLYPADNLFPTEPSGSKLATGTWITCEYEDYLTNKYDKLIVRKEENDVGATVGSGNNAYVIQDNFLVYGMSSQALFDVANNAFTVIGKVSQYRPFTAKCLADPCMEVGDAIRIVTKRDIIESYILNRTLKGIQGRKDTIQAKGKKDKKEKINSYSKSIKELKGKTNVLERSVEETRLTITDVEKGLQSQITANASAISLKVSKGNVSSEISAESGGVTIKGNRFVLESTNCSISANGTITASNGNFSGTITATSGTFDNVTIKSTCTVAGQSITGAITGASWQGSAIGDSYLSGISGAKVGSGFNAGNMTAGTVGRPYSLNGVSITSGGDNTIGSNGGTLYLGTPMITGLTAQYPIQSGGTNIGSSGRSFANLYCSSLHGSLASGSSREIKTNIKDYEVSKCLDVIRNTTIVSYNYKTDLKDNTAGIENIQNERQKYIDYIEQLEEADRPSEEVFNNRLKMYDENIYDLEHERMTKPETRYGFISEDAPWELVAMDRKSVDTYSAVAMCFGAIQVMLDKIEKLEEKVGV